jgi:hypothetical protein
MLNKPVRREYQDTEYNSKIVLFFGFFDTVFGFSFPHTLHRTLSVNAVHVFYVAVLIGVKQTDREGGRLI